MFTIVVSRLHHSFRITSLARVCLYQFIHPGVLLTLVAFLPEGHAGNHHTKAATIGEG
jgi:hypothetical protein